MRTILCPTNNTSIAGNAFAYATLLSEAAQAELVSEEKPLMDNLFRNSQRIFPLIQPLPDTSVERMGPFKDSYLDVYIDPTRQVQTVYSLAEKARTLKAELMIVGVEKNFGLFDMHSESMVNLVKKAQCPALFIPQEISFKPLKKILVVMSQEMNIDHRFSVIIDLAMPFGAEIIFLQVTQEDTLMDGNPFLESMKEMYLSFPYPHTSFHTLEHETLSEGISHFIENVGADMIAIVPTMQEILPYSYSTSLVREQLATTPLTIPLLAIDGQPLTTSNSVTTTNREGHADEIQQLNLYKKHI